MSAANRYTIEHLIGAGGMGQVHAARDTLLNRRVALKVLKSRDADRIRRFIREAEAASSLDHPAIVSVHDSGTIDVDGEPRPFLAMELVEGETLGAWLRTSRDPAKRLGVLAQVADGLACAHAHGIVHRDLKPENVMVTRDGYAKILDFGVAKLTSTEGVRQTFLSVGAQTGMFAPQEETLTAAIVGTTAYMSPEQVEGRAVDHRADVFSFGCVVYEAFAGRAPFRRETRADTLRAIVHEPPAPLVNVPPELQRILRRCLAKDPNERYQSIKDAALDLRELAAEWGRTTTRSRRWVGAVALTVLVLAAIGTLIARSRPAQLPPEVSMSRLSRSGNVLAAAISPDGRYLVHAVRLGNGEALRVRQIGAGTDVDIIPTTLDTYFGDVKVSPDGEYVYYTAATPADANVYDLWQIPILGGAPRRIAHDTEMYLAVAPDGKRVAFRRHDAGKRVQTLTIADVASGAEQVLATCRPPEAIGPMAFTPDGKRLSYVAITLAPEVFSTITDVDPMTGELTQPLRNKWRRVFGLAWLPDASAMVINAAELEQPSQLWIAPVDGGPPRRLTTDLSSYGAGSLTGDGGGIVTLRSDGSTNLAVVPLDDPKAVRNVTTGPGNYFGSAGLTWLPNGEIAYTTFEESLSSMFAIGVDGAARRRFTAVPSWRPALSPDGAHVAFLSGHQGGADVWIADASGARPRRVTSHGSISSFSWFPDSRSLVYVSGGQDQFAWKISIDGGTAVRLTDRPTFQAEVSPDGRSLLCRLRSMDGSRPLWRTAVVPIGGGAPRYYDVPRRATPMFQWLPDGSAFSFADVIDGAGNVWVQDLAGGAPRPLTRFDAGLIVAYEISRDGKQLAISRGDFTRDAVMIRGFR